MLVILLALGLVMADQLSKQIVRSGFALGESLPVMPGFFNLTYVRNTGAAWGMLHTQTLFLVVLSLVVLIVMIAFRKSFLADTLDHRMAFGLMVGGILGNLIDRIKFAWVTDFFDFRFFGWAFPTFNVADSAICIGVGLYLISAFWTPKHPGFSSPEPGSTAKAGTSAV